MKTFIFCLIVILMPYSVWACCSVGCCDCSCVAFLMDSAGKVEKARADIETVLKKHGLPEGSVEIFLKGETRKSDAALPQKCKACCYEQKLTTDTEPEVCGVCCDF